MKKYFHIHFSAKGAIGGKSNLCSALSITLKKFDEIVGRPDGERFRPKEIHKKNGVDVRLVYSPSWDLRVLLRRFNKRLFANPAVIRWPYYLFGCIPNHDDEENGRDYISCASVHANANSLVKIDIANFFPSITEDWVKKTFEKALLLSPGVAKDLAKINCVSGSLAQGSPCASYIAGAIFGIKEGRLVKRLESKGYRYTRYVDDITVSCVRRNESFALVIRLLDDLFTEHELERNIEKTVVCRSGASPLLVHGIRVGGGKIRLPREDFKAVRTAVKSLEIYSKSAEFRASLHYRRMYMRCAGLVGKLKRSGDKRSKSYYDRLSSIRPLSTQEDVDLCTKWVCEVEKKSLTRKNYFFHIRQANKTWARLAILSWTYPVEANRLRTRLRKHMASYDAIKL